MLKTQNKICSVYLDHAATTPVDPKVFKAMEPFFVQKYGNPSALYRLGLEANGAINDARRIIAGILHALPTSIVFTSGATEANNLAIHGTAKAYVTSKAKPGHIITTAVEHHAVLEPLHELEKSGWEVTYLRVDNQGFVKANDVIKAIRPDTVLVSIMYANNEIGTIEPIAEIGRALLKYKKEHNTQYPYFHTDAAQAAGYLDLDVEKLHVDLMTINGSKIYGPKGVGALYVRHGVNLEPLQRGGSQERNVRAGTENVPGIVGLAAALKVAQEIRKKGINKLKNLSEYFLKSLITNKLISNHSLNGPEIGDSRLPGNVNVTFNAVEGEALLIYLDRYGIMCSTGSACTATTREPSHVLQAIGKTSPEISSTVRFSLGRQTTKADITYTVQSIKKILPLIK